MAKKEDSAVAVYNTHVEAEEAVKRLQKADFDMTKLSIVGNDCHTEAHVVGLLQRR
jgi:Heat induced stress protein YflT domain